MKYFNTEDLICVGFGERLLANIIDALILLPVFLINYLYTDGGNPDLAVVTFLSLVISLGVMVYRIILPVAFGGTIGKLVLGIKVYNKELDYMSIPQSIMRMLPYLMVSIVAALAIFIELPEKSRFNVMMNIFALVEAIILWKEKTNRTLHDFMGHTYVLKAEEAELLKAGKGMEL